MVPSEEALVLRGRIVVRHQLEIERLDEVEVLVGRDRVVGGHEDVPAGGARLQLGQHFLIRAEHAMLILTPVFLVKLSMFSWEK